MDLEQGKKIIKAFAMKAPNTSGIYKMKDANNKVLYVGKAINLANRISSYANINTLNKRLLTMVSKVKTIEILICKSENEALTLEASLIKHLRPDYNILLKDDKSFPYIMIREDHDFGQILKVRNKKTHQGKFYGPFASTKDVNQAIESLQKLFKLRPCSDSYFQNRKKPCLEYEIKRCSAPCVSYVSKEEYQEQIKSANKFLQGKDKELQKDLAEKMNISSSKLEYEKAAKYRDQIKALNHIQSRNSFANNIKDSDYIAIYSEGEVCCIEVFFFRNGQNYGNKTFFPERIIDINNSEILSYFLRSFYLSKEPPKEVIVNLLPDNHKNLCEIIKTNIICPKSGEKSSIIDFVYNNAKNKAIQRLGTLDKQTILLSNVANLFKIPKQIKRIDVFDNSHISGKNALCAMIVVGQEGFIKNAYRTYNITQTKIADDYAMLYEGLSRRYKRMLSEYPYYSELNWPDLILIDGGLGHLSTAKKLFEELNLDIPFICIAKGPERNAGREKFYSTYLPPITLPKDDYTMQFLQRIRDEAHRFAITKHRAQRNKSVIRSELDDIPGIGKIKKKTLLEHFGSLRAIKSASIEELQKLTNINKSTATNIYNYLHNYK